MSMMGAKTDLQLRRLARGFLYIFAGAVGLLLGTFGYFLYHAASYLR